jgi:polyphenol oxidase
MEPVKLPVTDGEQAGLLRLGIDNVWDGVTAGFTTRLAGNTALHVGDDPAAVIERRRLIADRLGWDFAAWTCAEQVHGTNVHIVRKSDAGRGSSDRGSAVPDTDALITDEPDVLLVQYFADCVPLYFLDPETGAMGLAHAGWKGTVADIAGQTVSQMAAAYGTKPADLIAAVGPSIGGCCYEVDETVIRHVRPIAHPEGVLTTASEGRARLDLKELNRHFMIKAGILPSRIEMSRWCTGCRTDLFFSHRKENGSTGRMMSWLGRKSR